MAEISNKTSKARLTEEEIAVLRAERAAKKAEIESDDLDNMVSAHTLQYTFHEHVLDIEEDWSGPTSGMQWLGGVTLSRYFDNRDIFPKDYFKGKRVLEVGAGCGLTSLLLVMLGADVTMTDIDIEKAIPNIESNVDVDDVEKRSRIHLHRVDWFKPELERFNLPFDIIVSGDSYYQASVADPLLNMLWDVSDENTDIYHCGIVSEQVLLQFNKCIDQYFTIERLDRSNKTTEHIKDLPETRLRALMKFIRKPEIQRNPLLLAQDHEQDVVDEKPEDKATHVLTGPHFIDSLNMEIHTCSCSKVMQRELEHIFPNMSNSGSIIAIPTNQVSTHY